jgi:bacillithiol biosynthesis cysteine-adding enzyme BshC
MVAAVRWAETLEASGVPAIALFWVANEDHDFQETSRTVLLGKNGPVSFGLGDDPSPLMPVGMRAFGASLVDALDQARGLYSGLAAERWQQLAKWYRPDARFGEAFFRLMVAALGKRAPLMLDATDPELKKSQRPFLTGLVEKRHALLEAQEAADAAVRDRGLPLQVTPQPGASPLFLLRGTERRRILWQGETHWTLRGVEREAEPVETLLAIIRDNPAVVSPGVLARPAMQDAVLGTTLQVLGPSEMAYMAQAAAAYRVLDLPAPWTTLRPQTLVLERRQEEQLSSLGLSFKDLETYATERLIADRLGGDVVTPARARIAEIIAELETPIREIDATLEGPRAKTASQIDRSLEQLTGKVAGALARRHDVWHKRLEAIRFACWPGGRAQERTLAVAHFMVRYGEALGEAYLDQMALDPRFVQVVRL